MRAGSDLASSMRACLSISAKPDRRLSLSSVWRNWLLMMTALAMENTPISFLSPPRFIPVFPPSDAST